MPAEVSEGKSTEVANVAPVLPAEPVLPAPPPPPLPVPVEEPPAPGDPAPHCANCASLLTGPFCAQCGQHVADYHRSVLRFVVDFFDNVFCWDNKVLRTLDPLIKRPGWLTQQFMAGRRVRYVHPLRLFLFTSAICLTLLQFIHGFDNKVRVDVGKKNVKPGVSFHLGTDDNDDEDMKPPATPAAPSISPPPSPALFPAASVAPSASPATGAPTSTASPSPSSGPSDDSLAELLRKMMTAKDPAVAKQLAKELEAYGNTAERQAEETKARNRKVADNLQQKASWVALLMLPIFAWLMRFTYGKRGGYFFAHLVFSLHYHTFLLLFWTAYLGLTMLVNLTHLAFLGFPLLLGFLVPPWYLYLSLKRFYGESRTATAAKTFAIGGIHLLTIVIGLAIVGAAPLLSSK